MYALMLQKERTTLVVGTSYTMFLLARAADWTGRPDLLEHHYDEIRRMVSIDGGTYGWDGRATTEYSTARELRWTDVPDELDSSWRITAVCNEDDGDIPF